MKSNLLKLVFGLSLIIMMSSCERNEDPVDVGGCASLLIGEWKTVEITFDDAAPFDFAFELFYTFSEDLKLTNTLLVTRGDGSIDNPYNYRNVSYDIADCSTPLMVDYKQATTDVHEFYPNGEFPRGPVAHMINLVNGSTTENLDPDWDVSITGSAEDRLLLSGNYLGVKVEMDLVKQ